MSVDPTSPGSSSSPRSFDFYPLEERVLLNADAIDPAMLDAAPDADWVIELGADGALDAEAIGDVMLELDGVESHELTDQGQLSLNGRLEVVFVDASVEGADSLIAGLRDQDESNTEWLVFRLDSQADGVEQVSSYLSSLSNVDAVHIVSHGDESAVNLGGTRLDANSLAGYAADIAKWSDGFTEETDLLIYGCNLASTQDGQTLLESLSALTGADVAASDDLTGHSELGGDWDLEFEVGEVSTEIAFDYTAQGAWYSTLDLIASSDETLVNTSTPENQLTTPYGGGNVGIDDSGNYVIVWEDRRSGNPDVYAEIYNADGSVRVSEFLVHTVNSSNQDWANVAVADDGNFVVSWSDDRSGTYETYMRLFDIDGNAITGETLVSTGAGAEHMHAVDFAADGSFVITWQKAGVNSGDIYFQRFSASGVALGGNVLANTTTSSTQSHPDIAVNDDGSFVIAWSSNHQDGSGYGYYGQRFDAAGAKVGGEFRISETTTDNQWYGTIDSDGSGNFVATWMSNDGNGYGIFARQFDSTATALGNEFVVNAYTQGDQGSPNVAVDDDGDFVITWHDSSGQDAAGFGVYARQYDSSGNAIGGDTLINQSVYNDQRDPTVAIQGTTAIIAWSGNGTQSGQVDSSGVFYRQFSLTGLGPQTYTVTNTLDDGSVGSLRWAIESANANAGHDTITFDIDTSDGGFFDPTPGSPASGDEYWTINVGSALDQIVDAVTIDGATQTGYVAGSFLPIILDGNNGSFDALQFGNGADGSSVRGLVIRDFGSNAVEIQSGAENISVVGNYLGSFGSAGETIAGEETGAAVVYVQGANNTIGGTQLAERNVIAGGANGIVLNGASAHDNQIIGNFIGLDRTGSVRLSNIGDGVRLENGAWNNTVGGSTSAHGNVITVNANAIEINGETSDGNSVQYNLIGVSADGTNNLAALNTTGSSIFISSGADNTQILDNMIVGSRYAGIEINVGAVSDGTLIQGNIIGTDATGTQNWGQGENAILIEQATNTTIGGINSGEGNVIAFSGQVSPEWGSGVSIQDGAYGATIRGNSIYSNASIGIDLGSTIDDGPTPNDPEDPDSGANNLQNWAVLSSASISDSGTLSYSIDTNDLSAGTYTFDFYASTDRDDGQVEGKRFLFSRTLTGGSVSYNLLKTGVALNPGEYLTLVTTDSSGNSSEFSNYAVVTDSDVGGAAPSDLQLVSSTEGGLSINEDGGNDIYLISESGLSSSLSAATIELRFAATPVSYETPFFSYNTDQGDEMSIQISNFNGPGQLELDFGTGATVYSDAVNYENLLLDGSEHTLSVTWSSGTGAWAIYVDGNLIDDSVTAGESLAVGESLSTAGRFVFGQEQDSFGGGFSSSQTFNGTLYDARVFDDVRSAEEIAASYRTTLAYDEAGMVANWRFDSISPDGVVTEAVSGNNLRLEHATGSGFSTSQSELTFLLDENSLDGTVVGSVYGMDAEREALIASLLASDPELTYSPETGKFYKLVDTSTTWSSANSTALSTNLNGVAGQLATIRSASENQLIGELADSISKNLWLGGSDSTTEGAWYWHEAGSATHEQFWQGGAPSNGGFNPDSAFNAFVNQPDALTSDADFLQYRYASNDWNDGDATTSNAYVVEWDADSVLDATQALTYSIELQTVAGAFAIDSDNGTVTVADGRLLDYETNTSHQLTIRVLDGDGNTYDEVVTVSLSNLVDGGDGPSDLSSGIQLNSDGGNDAYLQVSDVSAFNGMPALTFEVTFSGLTDVDSMATLYSHRDPGFTSSYLAIHADGTLDWTGFTSSTAHPELLDGESHSIAVAWNAVTGDLQFYVDGQFVETASTPAIGSTVVGGSMVLGQYLNPADGSFDSADAFQGTLHDFRIWSEVRSEAEIALNYQSKFVTGNLPDGLIVDWQMDGFDGTNQVVDAVSGNNLSVGHASGPGFTASTPIDELHVREGVVDGTTVGFAIPSDANVIQDVVEDGLFLANGSTSDQYGVTGSFGDWTVTSGSVDIFAASTWESELGGRLVNLDGGSPGSIEQTLSTTVGQQYQVVFTLTGDFSGGESVKDLRVSAAGESQDFSIEEASNWVWGETGSLETRSFTFTADSTSTQLSFASLENITSQYGPYIGDIRVIEMPGAVTTLLNNDPALRYDAATGKFYKIIDASFGTAAENITNANNTFLNGVSGQLATVRSEYEDQLIQDFISSYSGEFLLGGTDATVEGQWNWINNGQETDRFWNGGVGGSAPTGAYSAFSGEPGGGTNENHLAIRSWDGAWLDTSGANKKSIIEWDANEVLSSFTFALTDDAGGRFSIDSSTGEIAVADGSLIDYETASSHAIEVQVTDASGNQYSELMTINVDDVGPSQSIPIGQAVDEDQSLVFSSANGNGITVNANAGGDTRIQVNLQVDHGTLTLTSTTGIVWVQNSNGATSMIIEGTESDINAALNGLQYTPDADYSGADTLRVETTLDGDLEGLYTFEGGTADDQSASSSDDGTLQGSASVVVDGERGDVLSLGGVGDFVEIPGTFGNPPNVTLAAWIKSDSPSSQQEVISLGDSVALRVGSSGLLEAFIYNGTTWDSLTTSASVNTEWNHVAMTFDDAANLMTVFLNGEAVGSLAVAQSVSYSLGTNTTIGTHGNGGANFEFDGKIDDARVYSRALSANEIASLASDEFSVVDSVAISVNSTNDAPVESMIEVGALSYTENAGAVTITSTLSITDVDDTHIESAVVQISGNYVNGEDILAFTNQNGITGNWNASNGTLTLSGSATLAQYELALRSVTYENTSEIPLTSTRTVGFVINDGDADSNVLTRDIAITSTNDDPTNTGSLPTDVSVSEDVLSQIDLSSIDLSDVDANGASLTVTLSTSTGGQLTVAAGAGITLGGTSTSRTITGSLSDLNAYFDNTSNIQYLHGTANRHGDNSDTISVVANDHGNTGSGGGTDQLLGTMNVDIVSVNDAPVLTPYNPVLPLVEDGSPYAASIASLLGTSVSDVDSGAVEGIAITDVALNGGTFEYRVDGDAWQTLSSASSGSALLLKATDQMRFTPSTVDGGISTFSYRAWDQTSGSAGSFVDASSTGGSTAFSVATDTVTVTVAAVNDAPVNTVPGTQTVVEESATAINGISIADVDANSGNLTSRLQVANGVLNVTLSGGASISSGVNGSGDLTLHGSVADINATLATLTYTSNNNVAGIAADTLTITTDDGGNTGSGGALQDVDTVQIDVTNVNDAPVESTIEGSPLAYTENGGAVSITSTLSIADVDDTHIESAVVQISGNYASGEDVLAFTNQNGISGSWNSTTGTLSLTGSATLAQYETALRSITYANTSENPSPSTRTVSFTVNDGDSDSNALTRDIAITATNDAPVESTIEASPLAYTENGGAVSITSTLSIADVDDTNIESAVVQISGNYASGEDVLAFTNQNGISGSWNSTTGTLSLTGSATLAQYETALRSITYANTSENPSPSTRTVSFTVNDGDSDSNALTRDIAITATNDAPVESTIEASPLAYTENGGAVSITSTLSIADVDDTHIESAVVQISGNYASGEDVLAFTNQNGISGGWNSTTGTLSLTGSATLAQYETALRSITYANTSENPSTLTRTVSFTVNDGDSDSNALTRDIAITSTNDDPINSGSLPSDIAVIEDVPSPIDLSAIDLGDVDAGSSSLTLTLSTSTGGELSLAAGTGVTLGGTSTARTLTGSLTDLNAYLNGPSNIQYLHGTPNHNGDNVDSITVVINDQGNTGVGGGTDQLLGSINVDIMAVNDSPIVGTNTGATVAEGGAVTITSGMLNESDVDDSGVGLTYAVTSGPANGQLELSTNPGVAINSFTQEDIDNNRVVFVHNGTQSSVDSFDFSLADGGEDGSVAAMGTFNFAVINVNDAPVESTIEPSPLAYTENGGAVSITSTLSIADVDDTHIESAVVQISGNFANGEDVLAFTNQNGISGSWNSTTGTLTLTGSATLAQYETAIRSITYANTSENPSTLTRTVTFTVNDGDSDSNALTRDIAITATNDAPVESMIEGSPLAYTENGGAVSITSTLSIADVDDTHIESAVVQISGNFANGEDVLAFTNQNGISGSWNSTTGTLTLTGSATLAQYETALRSITYANTSENPSTLTRTVSFTVNDGDSDSNVLTRDIAITATNDAPVESTIEASPLAYTENGGPVSITSTLSIADVDDTHIESAVVQISGNYAGGEDVLAFTNQNGISGSWNSTTGTLSLTGSATLAQYETAIRSITYANTSENPSTLTRTVTFTVNDGDSDSNALTRDIAITATNDAPVESTIEGSPLAYTENGGAVSITSTLSIADVDDTHIESAVVQISGNFANSEDVLAFTNQNGISGSWNSTTGTLSLTGSATLAQYETALRSITYANTSENPSTLTRTVSFTVNDGDSDSNALTRDIAITATNDAPVESTIEASPLAYTENGGAVSITSTLSIVDVDDTHIESAVVQISSNFANGEDVLAFTNQNGISGSWNSTTGTLSLTGSATLAQYETALRSITYANTSENPSTLTRTVNFTVNDGDSDSNVLTRDIAITATNDAPVESTIEASPLAYTENAGAVSITSTLSIADVDDTNIESAVVQISGNFANSEDVLAFTNQNGISGSWNSTTGTLTLAGSATLAQYETALRSITYANTSENPSTLTRTVSFTVNDGDSDSNALTRDISITSVNDAPVAASIEGSPLHYVENAGPVEVTSLLAISDVDDTQLESALVRIDVNYQSGEDELSFTDQNGIVGNWDALSGSLSLTGTATVSQYESALRSITYTNTSEDPSTQTRTIRFVVNDGEISSLSASRDIAITSVNDAPIASGESYTISAGKSLVVNAPGLIANDTDVENDSLSAILVSGPSSGALVLSSDGQFIYTPNPGFFGSDVFRYEVSDGTDSSNVVEVHVEVAPVGNTTGGGGSTGSTPNTGDSGGSGESSNQDSGSSSSPATAGLPIPNSAGEESVTSHSPNHRESQSTKSELDAVNTELVLGFETDGTSVDSSEEFGDPAATTSRDANFAEIGVRPSEVVQLEGIMELRDTTSNDLTPFSYEVVKAEVEDSIDWNQWQHSEEDSIDTIDLNVFAVSAVGTSAGMFSVGYVMWALRGGIFAATTFSSVPMLRSFDPTSLLTAYRNQTRKGADGFEEMLS